MSGCKRARQPDRFRGIHRFSHHREVRLGLEQTPESVAKYRMIVDDQDADNRRWSCSSSRLHRHRHGHLDPRAEAWPRFDGESAADQPHAFARSCVDPRAAVRSV